MGVWIMLYIHTLLERKVEKKEEKEEGISKVLGALRECAGSVVNVKENVQLLYMQNAVVEIKNGTTIFVKLVGDAKTVITWMDVLVKAGFKVDWYEILVEGTDIGTTFSPDV